MNKSTKLTLIIVVLASVLAYMTRNQWRDIFRSADTPIVLPIDGSDKTYAVKRVRVIKGDQFDIVMEGDARILAKLKVFAADQAKPKVLDLLNNCEYPKIRLVQKLPDGQWLIDFKLTVNNKEVDLASWLSSNKLVYQ